MPDSKSYRHLQNQVECFYKTSLSINLIYVMINSIILILYTSEKSGSLVVLALFSRNCHSYTHVQSSVVDNHQGNVFSILMMFDFLLPIIIYKN